MALENLSPVVREERLLAGEDLEPANRLEYFLKQAGSGGYFERIDETVPSFNTLEATVKSGSIPYYYYEVEDDGNFFNNIWILQELVYEDGLYIARFAHIDPGGTDRVGYISSDRTSRMVVD